MQLNIFPHPPNEKIWIYFFFLVYIPNVRYTPLRNWDAALHHWVITNDITIIRSSSCWYPNSTQVRGEFLWFSSCSVEWDVCQEVSDMWLLLVVQEALNLMGIKLNHLHATAASTVPIFSPFGQQHSTAQHNVAQHSYHTYGHEQKRGVWLYRINYICQSNPIQSNCLQYSYLWITQMDTMRNISIRFVIHLIRSDPIQTTTVFWIIDNIIPQHRCSVRLFVVEYRSSIIMLLLLLLLLLYRSLRLMHNTTNSTTVKVRCSTIRHSSVVGMNLSE